MKYACQHSLDVTIGDAINPNYYSNSDIVVLCDSLHHMGLSNEKDVITNSLNSASQKLIICDPFKDCYLAMLPEYLPGSQKFLRAWYNYIEKDGNNQVNFDNIRTKKELEELMMEGFGIISNEVKRDIINIGEDLIITYYL